MEIMISLSKHGKRHTPGYERERRREEGLVNQSKIVGDVVVILLIELNDLCAKQNSLKPLKQ
jgi:hypothetical protein